MRNKEKVIEECRKNPDKYGLNCSEAYEPERERCEMKIVGDRYRMTKIYQPVNKTNTIIVEQL